MSDSADAPNTNGEQKVDGRSKGWFKPGSVPNPAGRPKGSRNKLGEDFLRDALEAWKKNGSAALQVMAKEEPSKFCQMIAGILPKELHVNTSPVEELSADELDGLIASVRSLVAAATAQNTREGSGSSSTH